MHSVKCRVLPKKALNKKLRNQSYNVQVDPLQIHDKIDNYLKSVHKDALQESEKAKLNNEKKPF